MTGSTRPIADRANLVADGGLGGDSSRWHRQRHAQRRAGGRRGGECQHASFSGGDGDDTADYSKRGVAVTIRLDGTAVSGAPGENDTVGADVEGAFGGAGNDVIAGSSRQPPTGNGGNDTITGGTGRGPHRGQRGRRPHRLPRRALRLDRLRRGHRHAARRPGDSAEICEVAPDRDGDGTPNEQDCAPDNAAVHPGAGEIVGNAVDEDCKGGPQYLRVSASLATPPRRRGNTAKFTKLTVNEIKAGDTIEIRCTGGKRKACPFARRRRPGRRARPR